MIITHPILFNTIVVLFIVFTTAWIMYVINGKQRMNNRKKFEELEAEKDALQKKIFELDAQLHKRVTLPSRSTPVIAISSSVKTAK